MYYFIRTTVVWALCSVFCVAHCADRIALVIGNSAYQHTATLLNPTNDAEAVSEALMRLEFDVVSSYDQTIDGMRSSLREFYSKSKGAKVALFYYAGHGLQVNDKNYLIPVDAKLEEPGDLILETMELNRILTLMEERAGTNLVFLDACRNNPLASNLSKSEATRSVSASRGFAVIQKGSGMLITFATQPGNVALDGDW